jgi:hypothetical protein
MQDSTVKILDATLRADTTVLPALRNRILKLARTGETAGPVQNGNGHSPRIYNRDEAAKLLGDRTPQYVDQLCQRGLLKKFVPPGNKRAIGITGASLDAFIGV